MGDPVLEGKDKCRCTEEGGGWGIGKFPES